MTELARIHNEHGGYYFLLLIGAFSAGVIADDQHEIVRVHVDAPARACLTFCGL